MVLVGIVLVGCDSAWPSIGMPRKCEHPKAKRLVIIVQNSAGVYVGSVAVQALINQPFGAAIRFLTHLANPDSVLRCNEYTNVRHEGTSFLECITKQHKMYADV